MRTTITTFLLAAATATAAYAEPAPPAATPAFPDSAVTLTVQNNRSVPVTVFADQNDLAIRIGIVPAMQTVTLSLPKWASEAGHELRLFVHPAGGIDLDAQMYDVHPGARLALEVPSAMETPRGLAEKMKATASRGAMSSATVTVTNERDVDIAVFLQHGDVDIRLGTVPANSTRTLAVPQRYAQGRQSIDMVVHPESELLTESRTIDLEKGRHAELLVPKKR